MDRIEEHNIESEDLEQFVINILKGIKAADVLEEGNNRNEGNR